MANNTKHDNLVILSEDLIREKVYTIRGQQVMLDYDLAKIYGYTTKALNQQVQRNVEKFDGFIFKLTSIEVNNLLRSQIVTAKYTSSKRRYNPYAFTESGIYMLMTVLKGPLAIEQSRKLITIFKGMKDYIASANHLLTASGIIELTNQVQKNTSEISNIKNQLTVVMDNFIDPSKYKEFQILDGERIEAEIIYQTIYGMAHKSLILFDDYISIKTLRLLKICNPSIKITIFSDNLARDKLEVDQYETFKKESRIDLSIKKSKGRFHDRYIVIDYKTDNEVIYHSGPSSKDAGNKIATINRLYDTVLLDDEIEKLLNEENDNISLFK